MGDPLVFDAVNDHVDDTERRDRDVVGNVCGDAERFIALSLLDTNLRVTGYGILEDAVVVEVAKRVVHGVKPIGRRRRRDIFFREYPIGHARCSEHDAA